ncbi:MAG: flagellar basal body P-ring formation chaperone FlgA, partial [Bdellovibrionales bacterium]
KVSSILGGIRLADGLANGERLEFSGSTISQLLRNHKLWQANVKPTFTIPSRVVVENVGDKISEARVRMELISRWQSQCACRIELSELSMPKVEPWVAGTEWQLRMPAQPARGTFTVAIEMRNASGLRTVWLRGRATHYKLSPVAKRQINIGDRIQPEDYSLSEREITFARDAVPDAIDLIGRRARMGIAANDILFAGMLERERALKRGDQVKLALGEGDWEVAMTGIAEQDGFIGDTVKIRNPKSNQVVVATVIGRGEVRAE